MNTNGTVKKSSPVVRNAAIGFLRIAKWTPDRAVSTALYEESFAIANIPLLPQAKEFLARFGGLVIPYVTKSQQQDVLEFCAERTVQGMGGGGIECFEELIGVAPLCPIGHYSFGTVMLFMDSRGWVFGGSDELVTFIGLSGDEAVENILTGADSKILEPKTV